MKWVLVVVALTGCVHPPVFLGVATAGIAADCAATVAALNAGGYERNPLLGRNPTNARVVATCAVGGGLNAVIPKALPPTVRKVWWSVVAIVEFHLALHNLQQR